jgi:hypothetical protein
LVDRRTDFGHGPLQALGMLDHLDRARKLAATQGGVIDFEHATAWIAEEWAMFVKKMAERLPGHSRQAKDEHRGPGRPGGGDRNRPGGRPDDRRPESR